MKYFYTLTLALIICWLPSCTFNTKTINNPVLNKHGKKIIYYELKDLILPDEQLNFTGYSVTSGNKTTSELEIRITNAERLPQNKDELRSISIKISQAFKLALKDKKQYQTYKVKFVTRKDQGRTATIATTIKATEF